MTNTREHVGEATLFSGLRIGLVSERTQSTTAGMQPVFLMVPAPTKLMVPLININTNITSLNQYDVINIDQERQKANLLTKYHLVNNQRQ